MPPELPSPHYERDAQMRSFVHNEQGDKPEPRVVLTPKDLLVVALVSLFMLVFLSGQYRLKISLSKNVYSDEICTLYVLHLRSDFEKQTQSDEATWNFSTRWTLLLSYVFDFSPSSWAGVTGALVGGLFE